MERFMEWIRWFRPMEPEPGVPLESLPPALRVMMEEHAATYRSRLQLSDDAPLRVILPENPSEEFQALLFADGSFVTSDDEGYLDLGNVTEV